MSDYPRGRPPCFAHKFCRLLTKVCAANDIGPGACWLLTVVAHQEDAKRYKDAVTFWNEQLMPLCGFGSRSTLVHARQLAVEKGWLHYEEGGKSRPGRYWATVPERFGDSKDSPLDESTDDFCRTEIERQSGRQVIADPYDKRAPFFPIPIPKEREADTSARAPEEKSSQARQFAPPTRERLTTFCGEQTLPHDLVDTFLDHYTANGWMVGKHKMKDWRASYRNWCRREPSFGGNGAAKAASSSPKKVDAVTEYNSELHNRVKRYAKSMGHAEAMSKALSELGPEPAPGWKVAQRGKAS